MAPPGDGGAASGPGWSTGRRRDHGLAPLLSRRSMLLSATVVCGSRADSSLSVAAALVSAPMSGGGDGGSAGRCPATGTGRLLATCTESAVLEPLIYPAFKPLADRKSFLAGGGSHLVPDLGRDRFDRPRSHRVYGFVHWSSLVGLGLKLGQTVGRRAVAASRSSCVLNPA